MTAAYIPVTGYTAHYEITHDDDRVSVYRPVVAVRYDPDLATIPQTATAMVLDTLGRLVPVDRAESVGRLVGVLPDPLPSCRCS